MALARGIGLPLSVRAGRVAFVRALLILLSALATMVALPTAAALAHKGNPNFRSDIRGVRPATNGVEVEVLNYDDRLLLTNRSGKDVVIQGYDGEPYTRILADGTVQENQRSPAVYLNQDRFAQVDVPPQADPKAPPQWKTDAKTGRFEWHDHRIHWMSKSLPSKVKDKDVKTKIFNWRVPIRVGSERTAVTGTLFWQPESSSAPVAAFVALGGFCILLIVLVLVVRARRRRPVIREKAEAW